MKKRTKRKRESTVLVRVSPDVARYVRSQGQCGDSFNKVLKQLLGLK